MCVCVCVCVLVGGRVCHDCLCVFKREREREKGGEREIMFIMCVRKYARACFGVCVCLPFRLQNKTQYN